MSRRQKFEQEGRRAENRVARYLKLRGYNILEERFKTRDGEIDIIAQKNNVFAFVEVKQRNSQKGIDESMTALPESRIMKAAEIWVERHFKDLPQDFELRFDFATILGPVTPLCKVNYLENAFYYS